MIMKYIYLVMRKFKIFPYLSKGLKHNLCRDIFFIDNMFIVFGYLYEKIGKDELEKFIEYDIEKTVLKLKAYTTVDLYGYCFTKHIQYQSLGIKIKWKLMGRKAVGKIKNCVLEKKASQYTEEHIKDVLPCRYCMLFNTTFPNKLGFKAEFVKGSGICTSIIENCI
jgi:hypothetical protein